MLMSNLRLYLRLTRLAAVLAVGTLLAAFLVPVERLTRRDLTGLRQRLTRWWLARLGNALEDHLGRWMRRKPRAGIRISLLPDA